ncbi:hypothetical protein [Spirosoma jeollabukense]
MNAIFAKLNYKSQPEIAVINAPVEFLAVMDEMRPLATIVTDVAEIQEGAFAIAFLKTQQEVDALSPILANKLTGDGIVWIAYPKGSSKKHRCDFNRDNGWTVLGELGFEPVRMVAIDEDWSALRFRRVDFIKKMTRQSSRALTEQGKTKTTREAS